MIDILLMTDGRADCIAPSIESLTDRVLYSTPDEAVGRLVIHDDSGDNAYRAWLKLRFGPRWEVIGTGRRAGFGGAYRNAWAWCAANLQGRFLFSTEDDFTYNRDVNLVDLALVLDACGHLAQMALRRQPWAENEIAAGGVVEQHPDAYEEHASAPLGVEWLEHRLFWTTNPSLHRRLLCGVGWPEDPRSESRWARRLLDRGLPWAVAPDRVRFGYWGARSDPPWVEHIGHQRAGKGY